MAGRAAEERVPLSIVTGFLGSGKTTLIAALLRQPAMQGTAVVVNELGEVGIDDAIIAETLEEENLLLLTNGCLCCSVGDDLMRTLWTLLHRPGDRPRRIVIETTGLADPVQLLQRLMGDPRLRAAVRLDAVITTVDAVGGVESLTRHAVAARQCGIADRRLITKTDLVGPSKVDALAAYLKILNPGAGIRPIRNGAIDADMLFGASLYNEASGEADVDRWISLAAYRDAHAHHGHDHRHDHIGSVRSWVVEESRPVDWPRLTARLGDIVRRHGRSMLRLKGVVWTAGDRRPLVIHGVQQTFHSPVRIKAWPRPPRTSIVIIGEPPAGEAVALIAEALEDAAVADMSAMAFAQTAGETARAADKFNEKRG
jgi:G3E family GTPase